MKTPNVLGTAEAAAELGVEGTRFPRLLKAGRFPPPAANLGATPVWTRKQIDAYKRGEIIEDPLPLLGTKEAASLLGVKSRSQISRWIRTGAFPAPCLRLKAGPVWWQSDIETFRDERVVTAA